MSANLHPGFIALHGNQLEQLRAAVFTWLRANPLAPLEQEIILVQSNGVAEWLKIALAEEMGVCASTRITLPARFLWDACRTVLGPQQVPRRSALDEAALVWRLMRMLPGLLEREAFAPLRHYLADADPERRLQLAQRLADLFDEYQVYRADWLEDWAADRDVLRDAGGAPQPLPAGQHWQAQLWRALLDDIPPEERGSGRAGVHRRFVDALQQGLPLAGKPPRRVVVFGISALPQQTLQALGALAQHAQVVVAAPNPCRYYWGDIIAGRDLLRAPRRRQEPRDGRDLAALPLEQMHAHSHPLLAAWGRLGRDFVRMLDEFDDAQATRENFSSLRIDLFEEDEGATLLAQVQAAVRDNLPLQEHPCAEVAPEDRSIEFHVAHSAQREVEILHDRLLTMFAGDAQGTEVKPAAPLRPRDVVVMVPDIELFAPAIDAVFGQYGRGDARWIPYEIADVAERRVNPLLGALEWLLRLPQQRCLQSEVRDLLDVQALATRFGIAEADLPRLGGWIDGAGVRWGLDLAHRASLGLEPAGEQNAWIFGLRRMLLGYASGDAAAYAGIEPYAEVGGLDATLAGSLAAFVDKLLTWRTVLASEATPQEWGERARHLLAAFFDAREERDRLTLASLDQALQCWLDDCDASRFAEPVPLAVLRESWLGAIDEPTLAQRFVSGGVTFCTLMPMRAVPFRAVCLLGMNDGDYPRRARHADFDLLALPQLARPGDRSRRDDDRYLMLEALLAARDKLYVSWAGRNVRDNSEQPPSVLVSQLRDYLQRGWSLELRQLTTEHPLQPFSRRYFEEGGLFTWAREWYGAHVIAGTADNDDAGHEAGDEAYDDAGGAGDVAHGGADAAHLPPAELPDSLGLAALGRFLRQPVRYYFRERLQVVFAESAQQGCDEEPFDLNPLEMHDVARRLLDDSGPREQPAQAEQCLRARADRLARQGMLPIGRMGRHWQEQLVHALLPARLAWLGLCERFPQAAPRQRVQFAHECLRLDDWIDRLRSGADGAVAWMELEAGDLTRKPKSRKGGKHRRCARTS